MLKAELIEHFYARKHAYNDYAIDVLAKQTGHEVLRSPPYRCQLNPIEMVWVHVKKYVAQNNSHFKIDAVHRLLLEALDIVDSEQWQRDEKHVMKKEKFRRVD